MILQAYGEFVNKEYYVDDKVVESKVFDNLDFGYVRVTVESPQRDEEGNIILKKISQLQIQVYVILKIFH